MLDILNRVDNGDVGALDAKLAFKTIQSVQDGIMEQIEEQALVEAARYHKQDYDGYHIEIIEGAGRYSYDHIKEWASKKLELKAIELSSQEALKAMRKGNIVVTKEGEVVEAAIFKCTDTYLKLGKAKGAV